MKNKFTRARLYGHVACVPCEQWKYCLNDIHLQLCYSNFKRTHPNVQRNDPEYQSQKDIHQEHMKESGKVNEKHMT